MCLVLVDQLHFSEVGGKKKEKALKEEAERGICKESGNTTREALFVAEIFLGLVDICRSDLNSAYLLAA